MRFMRSTLFLVNERFITELAKSLERIFYELIYIA